MTTHRALCVLTVAAVISLAAVFSSAQSPASNSVNAPRLADGQPDVQGFWISEAQGGAHSVEDGGDPDASVIQGNAAPRETVLLVDPAGGRIPYEPTAAARRMQLLWDIETPTRRQHVDPHVRALLDGVPRINYVPGGLQIRQIPGYVTILYESSHTFRVIPMDGRPHVAPDVKLWMGDSRGRWDGNTLIVDVTNFNDKTWFDSHGTFHSDALHVVERWTMIGADRINYDVTIDDPKVFSRPWKIGFPINRNKQAGYEYYEDTRLEGERDAEEIILGGQRNKAAGRTKMHEHRNNPAGGPRTNSN
jgi:hypothetical protein